jgi:hypothetical protein
MQRIVFYPSHAVPLGCSCAADFKPRRTKQVELCSRPQLIRSTPQKTGGTVQQTLFDPLRTTKNRLTSLLQQTSAELGRAVQSEMYTADTSD